MPNARSLPLFFVLQSSMEGLRHVRTQCFDYFAPPTLEITYFD
jgi:hypothetical protein